MTRFANGVPVRTRLPAAVWVLAAAVALASMASSFAVNCHAATDPRLPVASQGVPQGQDPPGADENSNPSPGALPDESLSDQLDREQGVIEPPPIGDADIYAPAPDPDPGTTKVIPPPGTPGGDPTIEPK